MFRSMTRYSRSPAQQLHLGIGLWPNHLALVNLCGEYVRKQYGSIEAFEPQRDYYIVYKSVQQPRIFYSQLLNSPAISIQLVYTTLTTFTTYQP